MENLSLKTKHIFWIALISIICYSIAGYFAYPAVDDYEYANKAISRGFWDSQVYEYFNWNGRYIATAILSFNPLTWGTFGLYHALPSFLFLSVTLATWLLFTTIFKEILSTRKVGMIATIFSFFFFFRHIAPGQDFYWMSGSMTYTLPLVYAAVGYWALLNYFNSTGLKKGSLFGLTALMSFLMIGSNETIMVIWDFSLLSFFLYRWFYYKELNKSLIGLMLFSAAMSLVVLLAPGNDVRGNKYEKAGSVFRTVGNSLVYWLVYSIKFLSPSFLLYFIFNKDLVKRLVDKYPLFQKGTKNFRFVLFIWFGVMFLTMAPTLWGMGRRPNDRTLGMSIYFYQLIFPMLATQFYYKYNRRLSPWAQTLRGLNPKFMASVFLLSLLMYNNFDFIRGSLFYFGDYKRFMVERHELIKGREGEVVELEAYPYFKRPPMIIFKDIDTTTRAFAEYFGLKKVVITNPEAAREH